jgi:prepilin-type N-terminal cleavage/methylation domain-containing protein
MGKRAFTLLELMLVMTLIGLLGMITVPFYQSLQVSTQRETMVNEIIINLHRTKLKAVAAVDDQSWGLNIGDQITIFRGTDFQNRNQNYDEILEVPPTLNISGSLDQIVFNKFTGLPNSAGTIIISDTNGRSQNINISIQGTVDY